MLNIIKFNIIFLILFFKKDKLFIFFYLPEQSQEYISRNTKLKKDFLDTDLDNYEFAVCDIKLLDSKYKNLEATLMANPYYIPNRSNLIFHIQKLPSYFFKPLLKIILQTIGFISILIYLILLKEYYCINDIYFDINDIENNNINNTTINNNNKKNQILNNAFWYCKLGKCQVKILKEWSKTKIYRICHFIIFYGLIIFYKYFHLLTFKKLPIKLWILVIIKIGKYLSLLYLFILKYKDDKICSESKGNKNEYLKESLNDYDLIYLLINLVLEILDRII